MSGRARIAAPPLALDRTPWRRLDLSERRGIWCLVDALDYDWIIGGPRYNWGWHNRTPWKYYAKRNVGPERSTVYLHREIMLRLDPRPDAPELHVDHINGQSLDNRRDNLRWVTAKQNRANTRARGSAPSLDQIVAALAGSIAPDDDPPF